MRETNQLLPRQRRDNVSDTSRYAKHFPNFQASMKRQAIEKIHTWG